jgi:type I restriction enzyme, S subunit
VTVERVRVGEVLKLQRRPVIVDPVSFYEEIGVRSFGRGIFHKEPVSGASLGSKRVFEICPGDLVLSNVFAWEGAIAVASRLETGKIGSHRFMTYVARTDRIDANWACWFLVSEVGLAAIRRASPGSAGRNRTLAINRFEDLEIPLPSIEEQRRVAARIERAAALADQIVRLSRQGTVCRQALVEAMIRDRGHSDAKHALDGWRRVALQELARFAPDVRRVEPRASYEVAGIYSFGRGLFMRGRIDGADTKYSFLHRLRAGQLVMSRLKAWEGALAIVPPALDGSYVSHEFPTFDLTSQVDPEYLDLLVRAPMFWQVLASESKGVGARRERVNADRLLSQVVDLPPLAVQHEIARKVKVVGQVDAAAQARVQMTEALVPALLNEAFGAGLQ